MGIVEHHVRQAIYRRARREQERRRKRDGAVILFAGLVLYAILGVVAMKGDDVKPPQMNCARFSGVRPPTVRCLAKNVSGYELEWRLYGNSDDAITDFETKNDFRFEAPTEWRLIELRVVANDGRTRRWRAWVRWLGRDVEFRQYGRESE